MPSLSYRPGSSRFVVLGLVALGAVTFGLGLSANSARAQTQAPSSGLPTHPTPEFLLNRFNPATPGSDWFALESLDFRGHLRPAVRLELDWSQEPFVLEDCSREAIGSVVERQVFLHLGLGLTVASRARLAVDVPIAVYQNGTASPPIGGVVFPDPDGGTLGDIRASVDVRLFGQYGDPFVIAVGGALFFPTVRQPYTTDSIVRFMPRLLMAGQAGLFAYVLDFGFLSRDQISDRWFQGYGIGHELFAGAAVGIKPVSGLLLGAELVGYSKVTDGDLLKKRSTPAELLFGARYVIAEDFRVALGAGPGITPSKGSPELRFLARLDWFPGQSSPPPDADADGVPDAEDMCPQQAGVRTGDPQTNGCVPPPDRDRDGVLDSEDACPDDPGERSDNGAINGCPRPRDRDNDGAFDPADACPDVAGERTDDPKTNGCPPPDADKDGVFDREDACPAAAGEKTDDPRTSGCPDGDGDGVRGPEDACPELPGPANSDAKKNGCPLARVEKGQVRIIDQVQFKSASAVLLPESGQILEAVAKILKDHPEIKLVRVEGHTDNKGSKKANQTLSGKRAAAVVTWLVKKAGIEKARLTSLGVGMDRPIESNDTDEGRRSNRRVEFHIVDPAPAAP